MQSIDLRFIMKKRYFFLLTALIIVVVFSTACICSDCTKEEYTAPDNTVEAGAQQEVTWVEEDTGSSETEDVQELDEEKSGNSKLEGLIESPQKGSIIIFKESGSNIINGEVSDMGWYEELVLEDQGSGDSSEEHHHHGESIKCLVVFSGKIWGKIDESGRIYADLGGEKRIKYAFKTPTSYVIDENLTELAQSRYGMKPDSFTVEGNYYDDGYAPRADGKIMPDGYSWRAVDYSSY